eukprot:scaffold4725_cov63-Cyclotella_meneghiniana.AAC.2
MSAKSTKAHTDPNTMKQLQDSNPDPQNEVVEQAFKSEEKRRKFGKRYLPPPEQLATMSKSDLAEWRKQELLRRKREAERENRRKKARKLQQEMGAKAFSRIPVSKHANAYFPPEEELARMSAEDLHNWRVEQRHKRKRERQKQERLKLALARTMVELGTVHLKPPPPQPKPKDRFDTLVETARMLKDTPEEEVEKFIVNTTTAVKANDGHQGVDNRGHDGLLLLESKLIKSEEGGREGHDDDEHQSTSTFENPKKRVNKKKSSQITTKSTVSSPSNSTTLTPTSDVEGEQHGLNLSPAASTQKKNAPASNSKRKTSASSKSHPAKPKSQTKRKIHTQLFPIDVQRIRVVPKQEHGQSDDGHKTAAAAAMAIEAAGISRTSHTILGFQMDKDEEDYAKYNAEEPPNNHNLSGSIPTPTTPEVECGRHGLNLLSALVPTVATLGSNSIPKISVTESFPSIGSHPTVKTETKKARPHSTLCDAKNSSSAKKSVAPSRDGAVGKTKSSVVLDPMSRPNTKKRPNNSKDPNEFVKKMFARSRRQSTSRSRSPNKCRVYPADRVSLSEAAASGCTKCMEELEHGIKKRNNHDANCPKKGKRKKLPIYQHLSVSSSAEKVQAPSVLKNPEVVKSLEEPNVFRSNDAAKATKRKLNTKWGMFHLNDSEEDGGSGQTTSEAKKKKTEIVDYTALVAALDAEKTAAAVSNGNVPKADYGLSSDQDKEEYVKAGRNAAMTNADQQSRPPECQSAKSVEIVSCPTPAVEGLSYDSNREGDTNPGDSKAAVVKTETKKRPHSTYCDDAKNSIISKKLSGDGATMAVSKSVAGKTKDSSTLDLMSRINKKNSPNNSNGQYYSVDKLAAKPWSYQASIKARRKKSKEEPENGMNKNNMHNANCSRKLARRPSRADTSTNNTAKQTNSNQNQVNSSTESSTIPGYKHASLVNEEAAGCTKCKKEKKNDGVKIHELHDANCPRNCTQRLAIKKLPTSNSAEKVHAPSILESPEARTPLEQIQQTETKEDAEFKETTSNPKTEKKEAFVNTAIAAAQYVEKAVSAGSNEDAPKVDCVLSCDANEEDDVKADKSGTTENEQHPTSPDCQTTQAKEIVTSCPKPAVDDSKVVESVLEKPCIPEAANNEQTPAVETEIEQQQSTPPEYQPIKSEKKVTSDHTAAVEDSKAVEETISLEVANAEQTPAVKTEIEEQQSTSLEDSKAAAGANDEDAMKAGCELSYVKTGDSIVAIGIEEQQSTLPDCQPVKGDKKVTPCLAPSIRESTVVESVLQKPFSQKEVTTEQTPAVETEIEKQQSTPQDCLTNKREEKVNSVLTSAVENSKASVAAIVVIGIDEQRSTPPDCQPVTGMENHTTSVEDSKAIVSVLEKPSSEEEATTEQTPAVETEIQEHQATTPPDCQPIKGKEIITPCLTLSVEDSKAVDSVIEKPSIQDDDTTERTPDVEMEIRETPPDCQSVEGEEKITPCLITSIGESEVVQSDLAKPFTQKGTAEPTPASDRISLIEESPFDELQLDPPAPREVSLEEGEEDGDSMFSSLPKVVEGTEMKSIDHSLSKTYSSQMTDKSQRVNNIIGTIPSKVFTDAQSALNVGNDATSCGVNQQEDHNLSLDSKPICLGSSATGKLPTNNSAEKVQSPSILEKQEFGNPFYEPNTFRSNEAAEVAKTKPSTRRGRSQLTESDEGGSLKKDTSRSTRKLPTRRSVEKDHAPRNLENPEVGQPLEQPNAFRSNKRVKATKRKMCTRKGTSHVIGISKKLPYSIGTTVSKVFLDPKTGKDRPFSGEITEYDPSNKLYEIIYEDGDVEVIKEVEVSNIIVL